MAENEMTEQEAEELVSPFEWANEETLKRMIALLKIASRLAQRKLVEYADRNGILAHRGERLGVCDGTCPACKLRKEVGLDG